MKRKIGLFYELIWRENAANKFTFRIQLWNIIIIIVLFQID